MKRRQGILVIFALLWLCAVGGGLHILFNYEATPTAIEAAPSRWPSESGIQLDPHRPTLVMLAHPQCSCTRASVGELALIMTRLQGQVSAYVFFIRPKGSPQEWEKTELWRSAASIPGVTVLADEGGVEGARFGGVVSGQTLLYDPQGHLLFSGGITASRGHSGDNVGRAAVVALVTGGHADRTETLVFGCALHNPSEKELQEVPSWKK